MDRQDTTRTYTTWWRSTPCRKASSWAPHVQQWEVKHMPEDPFWYMHCLAPPLWPSPRKFGIITYMLSFVPKLPNDLTQPLPKLLRVNTGFKWNKSHEHDERSLQNVKMWGGNTHILMILGSRCRHYDVSRCLAARHRTSPDPEWMTCCICV